ncbi:hypothetical protein GC194_02530 [bacterium]|nr:hypothetical protein [bacterium]
MKPILSITWLLIFGSANMAFSQHKPLVIAHRGYSSAAPENSLAAFRKAIEAGADFFECDVRKTKDDSVVVLHDQNLKRTAGSAINLAELSYDELKNHHAGYTTKFGDAFAGEPIPTLRETLQLAKGNIKVEIEIKEEGMAQAVVRLVELLGMVDDVVVISFIFSEIQEVKRLNEQMTVKYLVGLRWNESDLKQLQETGGERLGVYGVPSARKVALAHRFGIHLGVYTINSERALRRAIKNGVDGITTNFPELALQLLAETNK